MTITAPAPFSEAIAFLRDKNLLPASLKTAQLDTLEASIRRAAFYSATVENARTLQRALDLVRQVVEPIRKPGAGMDQARAVDLLGRYLESIGYAPEEGKEGTIQDLQSEARRRLIVRTNVEMAQGYGQHVQANDERVLDAFPAQELFRLEPRAKPRDWPARWRSAGGRFYGGRMIARKDDDVWTSVSRFGNPYPPFDFNSGMWTRSVPRRVAISLGVIDADAKVQPTTVEFAKDLKMDTSGLSGPLKEALDDLLSKGWKKAA